MKELRFHRYQLPWPQTNSRTHTGEGLLLQLKIDGVSGYASIHPWISLGYAPVVEQIQLLQNNCPTTQMKVALELARKDAHSRVEKKGGIQFLPEIKNHFLFLDASLSLDQLKTRLKIFNPDKSSNNVIAKWKISPSQTEAAIDLLNGAADQFPQLYWRLDANSLFNFSEIISFWDRLGKKAHQQIQFIEDPCPYDRSHWNFLENRNIPLAIDFEVERWKKSDIEVSPTQSRKTVFVLKPEIQEMSFWHSWLKVNPHPFLLTSYLGHPVGMLHALWEAETFYRELPQHLQVCGLNLSLSTNQLQKLWPSIHQNECNGNCWQGVPGFGIGETSKLEELEWTSVILK